MKKPDKKKSEKDEEKQKKTITKNKKNKEEAKTRKQQKKKQKQEKKKNKKPRRRVFPIGLRIIVVLLLAVGALTLGLMIGYGVLGDGKALDALKTETWQQVMDIVTNEKEFDRLGLMW